MHFEILLAGIIASASAQVIKANQDPPVTPPPNLASTLVPTPPVDAQVTDFAGPEAHEKLLGPIGDLASAIVHSVETSVLGKVTDVPASELNKLSSRIAGKESQIINGAESAAAEASATKKDAEAGNKGEEKAPVETGRAGDANDGEDDNEDDKDHDHDDKDQDHDGKDHDHDDHGDKDHDKGHGDGGKEKQVDGGDDAAANAGEADAASTAGDDANAGDIADEANGHVGAEDKGEADLPSPEGLRNSLN